MKVDFVTVVFVLIAIAGIIRTFKNQILPEWKGKECKEWAPRRLGQRYDRCLRWE